MTPGFESKLIDGRALAAKVRARIAGEVQVLQSEHGIVPGLEVILVGEDQSSQTYVNSKEKAARQVGFNSQVHRLPATTTTEELLALVERLNRDPKVHGFMCQLPLPKGLDPQRILDEIRPEKDVDGFHPVNAGRLSIGLPCLVPCTPLGVMVMLKEYGVDPAGKQAVVVGRSNIVGKPMAQLLLAANATVTVCHSQTADLAEQCRRADILVAAIGRAKMISAGMVKPDAIVIDVGMNRLDGNLCGDVDFDAVVTKASLITPVPGGVGPMTIAMLLQNALTACRTSLGVT